MSLSGMLLWSLIAFASGAQPFAVWVAGRGVRAVGDGNPGAANAWRVGGWRAGVLVLALDFFKGALPVGAAHYGAGLSGWPLALIAVMPVAGHAFSPLLRGRGGKGLTVTFGVWAGLTLAGAPLALGAGMLIFYSVQRADAWSVLLSLLGLLAYLGLTGAPAWLLAAWAGNFLVLLWTHQHELHTWPGLRPGWARRLSGWRRRPRA